MLTQVVIQTSTPMSLDIDAVDPDEILILTSISGLSNTKTTLFLGEFSREGGYYQGRRAQPLNPVFNFKLNPNYVEDVEVNEIREILYRMFHEPTAESDAVQVLLKDTKLPDRYFHGYTESIDAPMFEKETLATVSMMTTDPYLRSAEETSESDAGGWFTHSIDYEGTADTGFELTLKVLANTSEVTIANMATMNGISLVGNFQVNDTVYINTNKGQRAITKNGVDIMGSMSSNSVWMMLKQASNLIRVYGETLNDGKVVVTNYKYRAAWWGI